jgi:hypothetical protein
MFVVVMQNIFATRFSHRQQGTLATGEALSRLLYQQKGGLATNGNSVVTVLAMALY